MKRQGLIRLMPTEGWQEFYRWLLNVLDALPCGCNVADYLCRGQRADGDHEIKESNGKKAGCTCIFAASISQMADASAKCLVYVCALTSFHTMLVLCHNLTWRARCNRALRRLVTLMLMHFQPLPVERKVRFSRCSRKVRPLYSHFR